MKWLNRSLVYSPVYYGLCLTEKDFHKELKKMKVPEKHRPNFINPGCDGTMHHFVSDQHDECCIVCVRRKRLPVHQVAGLLVHEAVHVWQYVRRSIGEEEPSAEFEAYSIQTISQFLIEAYYDKGKKK